MRQGRIKAPGSPASAIYNCTSRVVDRRFALGEPEKNQFMNFMREYEGFCDVDVLTFNILSNHFHILLKVRRAPEVPLTDEELLRRIESLSGSGGSKRTRRQLTALRQQGQTEAAEALRFVRAGGTFVPASALIRAARKAEPTQERPVRPAEKASFQRLTRRELEVLARLREGKPNKIIAHELAISEGTVKAFVRRILIKLQAINRTEVAYLANRALDV